MPTFLPRWFSALMMRTPIARTALTWARNRYDAHRYNRFDTCSPDAIPALKDAFSQTTKLPGDYYVFGICKVYVQFAAKQIAQRLFVI